MGCVSSQEDSGGYFGGAQWKKHGLWLPLQLLAVWMTKFALGLPGLLALISTSLF